jgi:hypothetical protein
MAVRQPHLRLHTIRAGAHQGRMEAEGGRMDLVVAAILDMVGVHEGEADTMTGDHSMIGV